MLPDFYDLFKAPDPAQPANVVPIAGRAPGGGYGQAALQREVDNVAGAVEGTRNHALNTAAFNLAQLVASGHLEEGEVRAGLAAAAHAVGLSGLETQRTVESGLRAGRQHPRQVQPAAEPAFALSEVDVADIIGAPGELPEGAAERTSWWPEPVLERAARAAETPPPNFLLRVDGRGLFYAGKVNGLLGESESGKSWIGLHAVAQHLAAGGNCLFLDFEDSPVTIRDRLRALGVTDAQLQRLEYAHPDQALDVIAARDLHEAVERRPDLIIVDGVNAAMSILGLDLNSNQDATLFNVRVLKPLTRHGTCVVTIDHVPKNVEARGKGGIGAQAKRAMLDGCALTVEVVAPFGRGQDGTLKLLVDKDRPGHVRGHSAGGKYAGKAVVTSSDDEVSIVIETGEVPTTDDGKFRPTRIMEKVSRFLEDAGETSKNGIHEGVRGKRDYVIAALQALVDERYVSVRQGTRNALLYRSMRPYFEALEQVTETTSDDLSPTSPRPLPGEVESTSPRPAPPYGGGERSAGPSVTPTSPLLVEGDIEHCNGCGSEHPADELELMRGYCPTCRKNGLGR